MRQPPTGCGEFNVGDPSTTCRDVCVAFKESRKTGRLDSFIRGEDLRWDYFVGRPGIDGEPETAIQQSPKHCRKNDAVSTSRPLVVLREHTQSEHAVHQISEVLADGWVRVYESHLRGAPVDTFCSQQP